MRILVLSAALACAVLTLAVRSSWASGQDEAVDKARLAAYDKGPAKIDVSKYPPAMQAAYKVFAAKCGKCHTLARAINSEYVLDEEWERYVKRMMRKSGDFITPAEGKEIFDFVVYDSKVRKKDLYDRKLKDASK